jgi:hypothetical protein
MTTPLRESGWDEITADAFWPGAGSSILKSLSMVTNFGVILQIRAALAVATSLPIYETLSGFMYIGELTNEDKNVPQLEDPAPFDVKSHYSQKDGITASRLTAAANAPRCSVLREFGLGQAGSCLGPSMGGLTRP